MTSLSGPTANLPPRSRRRFAVSARTSTTMCVVACALVLATGCKKKKEVEAPPASSLAAPAPSTPDRVAPGELIEGEKVVWGFRVPRDMKPVSEYPKVVTLDGEVTLAPLEDYVRSRVVVAHIEVTPTSSIFPDVRIRGGDPNRVYRFELRPIGTRVMLEIRDMTRDMAEPGLTQEERWRKVGIDPSGKPIPGKYE